MPARSSVRSDRADEPNLADMAGFTAGKRINLCDFSNSIVGAFLEQKLYGFSYKIQAGAFLEQILYGFSYKIQVGAFLEQNLYDFSYKIQVGAFLEQNLYDISYKIQARRVLGAEFV